MSELITEMTHWMEQVGNFVVKLTEDGTEAVHLTSITHVVGDDNEHSFVLSAAKPGRVEGAVHQMTEGEIQAAVAEKKVEVEESETQKEPDDSAKSDKTNVTDDAGTTASKPSKKSKP